MLRRFLYILRHIDSFYTIDHSCGRGLLQSASVRHFGANIRWSDPVTTRRAFIKLAIAAPIVGGMLKPALAATPEIFNTNGYAIHGYDPVAYFTNAKAVDGNDTYMLRWMGADWRFSSAKNMGAFEANPRSFAPRYGGYCAYAMSQGAIATSVPEAWTIHKGALYLNYSTGVRGIWKKDIPGYIAAANDYWPGILNG